MSLLFQEPTSHIASHMQRYLVQQSGHNGELPYQQQQQQQLQSGGEGNMMTIEQQQQWHQQQVVTASAKKQQISSRQIGKLQPQMPNYLFSNARYNPTSQKKANSVAIDPVIAAAAAKIAAAASAALEELTAASGVISPLGRLSSPSQQYYAQMPYPHPHQQHEHVPTSRNQHHSVPLPRQQQPQLTHQLFPSSSPKQQARGGEDCELFTFQNNDAHSQSFSAGEHVYYCISREFII